MTSEQIEAYKGSLNLMAKALREEWGIATKKGASQYASNLNGRIKGIEFSLVALNDAANDG